jgi:hypothetical protein
MILADSLINVMWILIGIDVAFIIQFLYDAFSEKPFKKRKFWLGFTISMVLTVIIAVLMLGIIYL